jgi:GGDEF domain-containing protein
MAIEFGRSGSDSKVSALGDTLGTNRVFYVSDQGLVTQWYLEKRCTEECYRSKRYERPLSFILVQSTGAEADAVQRQVGAWVRKDLRVTDIAARLGGGRYAVLLVETSPAEADTIAGRLYAAVRDVDIGVCHFPDDGASLDELLAAAESNLGVHDDRAA